MLRLGLLSSALTLQRKRMQFDNLQKKSFMVQISVRHCKKLQKVPYKSVLESQIKMSILSVLSVPSVLYRLERWSNFFGDVIEIVFFSKRCNIGVSHTIPSYAIISDDCQPSV